MSAIQLDAQYQQQTVVKEIYRNFLLCVTQLEQGYRGSLHKGSQHYFDAIGSSLDNLVQQLRNQVDNHILNHKKIDSKQLPTQSRLNEIMQVIYPTLPLSQQHLLLAHLDTQHSNIGCERSFDYLLQTSTIHSCSDILIAYALIASRVSDELGLPLDLSDGELNSRINLILKRRIDEKGREHFKLHRGIVDAIINSAVSR
jgi:hypothetical protein